MRHHRRNRLCGRSGSGPGVRSQCRLAAHRLDGQLHADDELGCVVDERGVRPQTRAEPRRMEVRHRLGGRPPPEERPSDVHAERHARVVPRWHRLAGRRAAVRVRGDLSRRTGPEPARLLEGGGTPRCESEGGLALGARRDGTRRPRSIARAHARGVHHVGQVPRGRHHQQGEPATADPHVGPERDAR